MHRNEKLDMEHVRGDSFSSCSFNSEYSNEQNNKNYHSKKYDSNLHKKIEKLKQKNKKLTKKTHKKNKKIKNIRKKFIKRIRRSRRRYKNNSPSSGIKFTQIAALLCCPTMAIPYLLYKNMFTSKRDHQKDNIHDDDHDGDDSDQSITTTDAKNNLNNSKHILVIRQDEIFNNHKTITSINWIDFIKFLVLKFQIISYLPVALGVNLSNKINSFYTFWGLFTSTSIRYFNYINL